MQNLNKNWFLCKPYKLKELNYVYAPYSTYFYFNISLIKFINKFNKKGLKIKIFKFLLHTLMWFSKLNFLRKLTGSLNYILYGLITRNSYAHVFKLIKNSKKKKSNYEYKKCFLLASQRRWSYVFYIQSLINFYDISHLTGRFIYFFYDSFNNFNSSLFKQYMRIIK